MDKEIAQYLREHGQGTLELLHNMENYLFIIDFRGDILLCSDSLFEATGLARKDVYSSKYHKYITYKDRPINCFDLLLLGHGKRENPEVKLHTNGQEDIPGMVISSSLLNNFYKNEDFILLLIADIREQKKAHMKLMHTNKMLSLGEMATNIAHEINNPLSIIGGQLKMLEHSIKKVDGDTKRALEITEKVGRNFDRITKIVQSLRNLTRKTEEIVFDKTQVSHIIEGVKDLCDQRLFSKDIKFEIDGLEEDDEIICHETEIMQVILNLINNAVDSILENEEKWIKLSISKANGFINFTVTDSGKGIDLKTQIHLFEPFFTTKDIGKGTGLGLSISKGLVEAHGGTLSYDPEKKNTTFNIMIPIQGPKKDNT